MDELAFGMWFHFMVCWEGRGKSWLVDLPEAIQPQGTMHLRLGCTEAQRWGLRLRPFRRKQRVKTNANKKKIRIQEQWLLTILQYPKKRALCLSLMRAVVSLLLMDTANFCCQMGLSVMLCVCVRPRKRWPLRRISAQGFSLFWLAPFCAKSLACTISTNRVPMKK